MRSINRLSSDVPTTGVKSERVTSGSSAPVVVRGVANTATAKRGGVSVPRPRTQTCTGMGSSGLRRSERVVT
jgi:hypothetical protein